MTPRDLKVHMREPRMLAEEGVSFPVCKADNDGPVDLRKADCLMTSDVTEVTCKRCLKAYTIPSPRPKLERPRGTYKRRT